MQIINFSFFIFLSLVIPKILSASSFHEDLNLFVQKNENKNQIILRGDDDWLQLNSSLRFVSYDVFWGGGSILSSKARDLKARDPLSAILDFNSKLKKNNIELILVPIPVKASLYPAQLIPKHLSEKLFNKRLDYNLKKFINLLGQKGVNVVDLYDNFVEGKKSSKIFCKTDSHWTSNASFIAAKYVANILKKLDPNIVKDSTEFQIIKENISVVGDLTKILNEDKEETLEIIKVLPENKTISRNSPILVLGDSHTLVFHAGGDFHSKGSGFPDHLAFHIGQSVDLLGVKGSASTVSRIKMLRQNRAKEKKIIVWVFSSREFTESTVGWKRLPVIK